MGWNFYSGKQSGHGKIRSIPAIKMVLLSLFTNFQEKATIIRIQPHFIRAKGLVVSMIYPHIRNVTLPHGQSSDFLCVDTHAQPKPKRGSTMADYRDQQARFGNTAAISDAEYDQGLRSFMLGIYNYMSLALAVTGLAAMGTAWLAANNPAFAGAIYNSPLRYVIMFSPLAFVLVLSFGINKLSTGMAQLIFWAFAAVMGMSMSWIFMVYTSASIVQTFFITAAAFASLSLYGYTTKRSLSAMGSFMMMGLFGLIIAMVVNIFLQSSAMQFAISAIGLLIFAGLTAWDTQRLKLQYDEIAGNAAVIGKATIMGALNLYLNFINMFMFMLQLFGSRD